MEAIGVALVVAQHHVMLGIQIIIMAVIGKQQPIDEKIVNGGFFLAEERAPHLAQRLLFDFAKGLEQILSYAAQDALLIYLKAGKMVAQHHRLARIRIAWPLKSF